MSISGNDNLEIEERYSLTSHMVARWRDRIGYASYDEIKSKINNIIKNGDVHSVDSNHYRVCYGGLCIVFMKLSPLHSLAKTVYQVNSGELGAN